MCMPHVCTTKWSGNQFANATNVTKATVKCVNWHPNVHRMRTARRIRCAMMAYAFVKKDTIETFLICKLQFDCMHSEFRIYCEYLFVLQLRTERFL